MHIEQVLNLAVCLLWLACRSSALVLSTPTATQICRNHGLKCDLLPLATPPPQGVELRLRRQAQSALATCGFINGDGDRPVTCGSALYCATMSSYVGCCERSNCLDIFTSCYDLLGAACNQACQNNPQNLVCPTSLQYCARYNYVSGSVGFGCASFSGFTSSVYLTSGTGIGSIGTSDVITTTSNVATSSTSTSPAVPPPSTGLSTGATAGVAVGATLGVVAVVLIGWFFYRRSKKPKPAYSAAPTQVFETKEAAAQPAPDRTSKYSELTASPRSPISPEPYQSGGFAHVNPYQPQYNQNPHPYYEMDGNNRPISDATTELGSTRATELSSSRD